MFDIQMRPLRRLAASRTSSGLECGLGSGSVSPRGLRNLFRSRVQAIDEILFAETFPLSLHVSRAFFTFWIRIAHPPSAPSSVAVQTFIASFFRLLFSPRELFFLPLFVASPRSLIIKFGSRARWLGISSSIEVIRKVNRKRLPRRRQLACEAKKKSEPETENMRQSKSKRIKVTHGSRCLRLKLQRVLKGGGGGT